MCDSAKSFMRRSFNTSADDGVQDAGDVHVEVIRRPRLKRHVGCWVHLGEPAAEASDAHDLYTLLTARLQ